MKLVEKIVNNFEINYNKNKNNDLKIIFKNNKFVKYLNVEIYINDILIIKFNLISENNILINDFNEEISINEINIEIDKYFNDYYS